MSIIGIIAMLASLTIVCIGLPAQIRRNYRQKNVEGIAPPLIYSAVCTYVLWAIYGITESDWYLVIPYVPGGIMSLILLFQLFRYRKRGSAVK